MQRVKIYHDPDRCTHKANLSPIMLCYFWQPGALDCLFLSRKKNMRFTVILSIACVEPLRHNSKLSQTYTLFALFLVCSRTTTGLVYVYYTE